MARTKGERSSRSGRSKLIERIRMSLLATLAKWLVESLGWTWRIDVREAGWRLDSLRPGADPVILTFWHDQSVLAAYFFGTRLRWQNADITTLASRSRDGEIIARVAQRWGSRIVRGSARRGGREALWGTYKAVVREGSSPIVVPDGPLGPSRRFKPGVVALGRLSRAPLILVGFAADRVWRLRSWDRIIIPKPFAQVRIHLSRPVAVPSELDPDGVERQRQHLEDVLNKVTRDAEEALAKPANTHTDTSNPNNS